MTDQATPAKVRLTDGLGPMRDAALTELENTTNQTWLRHRKRWAALVRAQDAEIQRLQRALHEIAEEWAGAGDVPGLDRLVSAGLCLRGAPYDKAHYYHATVAGCAAAGLSKAATKRTFED